MRKYIKTNKQSNYTDTEWKMAGETQQLGSIKVRLNGFNIRSTCVQHFVEPNVGSV